MLGVERTHSEQHFLCKNHRLFFGTSHACILLTDQEVYIRALNASALCTVNQIKLDDPNVLFPSTVQSLIDSLVCMEKVMSLALSHPRVQNGNGFSMKCIAHVLNGTIHITWVYVRHCKLWDSKSIFYLI